MHGALATLACTPVAVIKTQITDAFGAQSGWSANGHASVGTRVDICRDFWAITRLSAWLTFTANASHILAPFCCSVHRWAHHRGFRPDWFQWFVLWSRLMQSSVVFPLRHANRFCLACVCRRLVLLTVWKTAFWPPFARCHPNYALPWCIRFFTGLHATGDDGMHHLLCSTSSIIVIQFRYVEWHISIYHSNSCHR